MGAKSRLKRERRERVWNKSVQGDGIAEGRDIALSTIQKEDAKNVLSNPISRLLVKLRSKQAVIDELSKGTVDDQSKRVNTLIDDGVVSGGKARKKLEAKAYQEMNEGIRRFQKQGKPITVSNLLAELRSEPSALKMFENVGLDYSWFEDLARERMNALGVK